MVLYLVYDWLLVFRSPKSTKNAFDRLRIAPFWSRSRRPRTGRVQPVSSVRRAAAVVAVAAAGATGRAEGARRWSCAVIRCRRRRRPPHPNGQKLEAADKRLIFYIGLLKYSRGVKRGPVEVGARRPPSRRYRWLSFRRAPDGPPASNRAPPRRPDPNPVSDHTFRPLGDSVNL